MPLRSPHKKSRGFTLIELVMVIVVLGLLSGMALPRFVDLKANARTAAFQTLRGAILAAANMARAKQATNNIAANSPITVNGQSIAMVNGFPADASIGLLVDVKGFTWQPATGWFVWQDNGSFTCMVDYNQAGWHGNPTTDQPHVTITTSGC